jgi:hypothetical protein
MSVPESCSHALKAIRVQLPALAAVGTIWLLAAGARAATTASIAAAISPDRLGAHAMLIVKIAYSGGPEALPSPVRRSVLRLPEGLTLDIPRLRGCSLARLRAAGGAACPVRSRIGGGRALMEVHLGSQTIRETAVMHAFLGFPAGGQPTFEILACGRTPLDQCEVFTGAALSARRPYGERLVMSIPPIPTLPLEPYASIVDFTLRIGDGANSVLVPARCPASGFPFAAEFTYADGSRSVAEDAMRCPS